MPVGFSPSAKRAEGFDLLLVYLTQQMFSTHSNNEPRDTKGQILQSRDSLSTANEASTEQLVHKHQSLYSWLNSLVGCLRNNSAVEEQLLLVLVLGNVPGCNTTIPQVCCCMPTVTGHSGHTLPALLVLRRAGLILHNIASIL